MEGNHKALAPLSESFDYSGPVVSSHPDMRFCDIADHLPDAVLAFNADDKCDFANSPASRLFGLHGQRMQGIHMAQLGLPDELGKVSRDMLRRVRDTTEPQSLETVCDYKGQQRHFEARFIPQRADAGRRCGVIMVVRDITEFRQAEEAARLNARRVKQVSRQVLRIQEQSSRHLARELHDEIGQTLTAVKFSLQNMAKTDNSLNPSIPMAQTIEMVSSLLERIRSLSLDLRPSLLDDLGLEPALRSFARRQAKLGQFEIDLSFALPKQRLEQDMETTCYRIFQEGLTNILKYASASEVWIRVSTDDHSLYGYLADNGGGFDVDAALDKAIAGHSTGLLSMQERAMLMGGRLRIESATVTGTRYYLELPLVAG